MPDTSYSDAYAEALASAPTADLAIDVLEINYTGLASPVYLYRGTIFDTVDANGIRFKRFRLEPNEATDDVYIVVDIYVVANAYDVALAGLVFEAIQTPFDVLLPDIPEQGAAKGRLMIDGVSRAVSELLRLAVSLGVEIDVTYRPYLESGALVGPEQTPPILFALGSVTITSTQVSATIEIPTQGNRRFPRDLYRPEAFPTLTR